MLFLSLELEEMYSTLKEHGYILNGLRACSFTSLSQDKDVKTCMDVKSNIFINHTNVQDFLTVKAFDPRINSTFVVVYTETYTLYAPLLSFNSNP